MYAYISILLLKFGSIYSNILEAEKNFEKPKLEHNNIVNKGVWVRNKVNENLFEKPSVGDFLFRPNSLDVDNILQNNFDVFGTNNMQDIPFVSTYVERAKRSTNHKRKRRPRKSMRNCKNKIDCGTLSKEDKIELSGTKLIADLKPSSVYNDYPYEVAILVNNNKKIESNNDINEHGNDTAKDNVTELVKGTQSVNIKSAISINNKDVQGNNELDSDLYNIIVKNNINNTLSNNTVPKRNKKHDYYEDEFKNIEFIEDFNKTDGKYPVFKTDRAIFDQHKSWNTGYVHDTNVYKVAPKIDGVTERSKQVTERGLIKVISMLTKTYKKVMKYHNEIKGIHEKLLTMNDDFLKNLASINEKFQSFEEKYSMIMKFDEKLKDFDKHLKSKEDYFRKKEKDMSHNLLEFENQQKNFLNQQKQFYAIQKLILAQNEKINMKQNLIAKTQSEISHRQNNFARILKKAKQLYLEAKNPVSRLNTNIAKPKDYVQKLITTTSLPITESIKINLFSIPAGSNKLEIKDDSIIKEKDQQPIDDLVYKYYFNNTFIDNLIKSKIFSVIATPEQVYPKSKNKRNGPETTLLLPINNSNNRLKRSVIDEEFIKDTKLGTDVSNNLSNLPNISSITLSNSSVSSLLNPYLKQMEDSVKPNEVRHKRWIKHPKKSHKHHHEKSYYLKENHKKINLVAANQNFDNVSADPFLSMATKFCVEIGQNVSEQVLGWCVKKTLRRLQVMDTKIYYKPAEVPTKKQTQEEKASTTLHAVITTVTEPTQIANIVKEPRITEPPTLQMTPTYTVITEASYLSPMFQVSRQDQQAFFPGNEELETNLKQFELTPDTEGNFYYDGSLHASDIITGPDSGGNSDILPGFDSNSHMDVDPYTLYLQAMRRASVRKINEDILRNLKIH